MNIFGRILTELKGTITTNAWEKCASVPALILFWWHLRRLTAALDSLFAAWRAGTLPLPAQPAISAAQPAPDRPPATAPSRASAPPRRTTARVRVRPAQPQPLPQRPVASRTAQPHPIPRSPAMAARPRPPRRPQLCLKFATILPQGPHCAQFISISK